MITLTIDNKRVKAAAGASILEAALQADIYIPNICYHPDLKPIGSCRLCVVQVEGRRGLVTACGTAAAEGMQVLTDTPEILRHRRRLMWLILSEHPKDIAANSQLMKLVKYVGCEDLLPDGVFPPKNLPRYANNPVFIKDLSRCILCGRCVQMCQDVRGVGVVGFVNRGIDTIVGTNCGLPLADAGCRYCGACVEVCPSGALVDEMVFEEGSREKALVPCRNTCPAQIDIPRYVGLIAKGRYQDSLEVVREKVPLPHTLGCVCDHPCERECRRGIVNDGISIRNLKRFVAEQDTGRWRDKLRVPPHSGKQVAIVGSGPAGLTAAWFLRLKGHAVTIFDALPKAGGMLRIGIPKYRLPREVLDAEIDTIRGIGVEIRTNTKVRELCSLFEQGYDAVFLAVGAMKGMKMGIPGEESALVLDGIETLKSINLDQPVNIKGHVAVTGGGNVAIDVARCALRTGADKVTMLYRRTREEMPAAEEEIREALNEGVEIMYLVNPLRVEERGAGLAITCIRMELGAPDASGRRRPVPKEGSEFVLEVDRLAIAIGQYSVVPKEFEVELCRRGRIATNGQGTSRDAVFAGGDAAHGPASVIEAIEAGRKGAGEIDRYLGGDGDINQEYVAAEPMDPRLHEASAGFAFHKRVHPEMLAVAERLCGNPEVEKCFTECEATEEATRCMSCQLRLQISSAPMPPEGQ